MPACCGRRQKQYNTMKNIIKAHLKPYAAESLNTSDDMPSSAASSSSPIPLLIEISSKAVTVSAALFWLDYRIAVLTLFLLTMPLYVPKLIEKRLQNAKKESIDSFQKHLGNIVEWLSGFELIKNYSVERVIRSKFQKSNDDVSVKLFRFKRITYLSKTITALLSYMSHFIVIVATAALVLSGEFSAGDFFIAVGLIDQLSYPIIAISLSILPR